MPSEMVSICGLMIVLFDVNKLVYMSLLVYMTIYVLEIELV